EPARATASFVTGGMLQTLGVAPLCGRLITASDDQPSAPLTANISYGLWKSVYGGDRHIVGRGILLHGSKRTVVGVIAQRLPFSSRRTGCSGCLRARANRSGASRWPRIAQFLGAGPNEDWSDAGAGAG